MQHSRLLPVVVGLVLFIALKRSGATLLLSYRTVSLPVSLAGGGGGYSGYDGRGRGIIF